MKASLKTISLFASAALSTLTSLSAVETDPVGYITINSTDGDDVVASPQLLRPATVSGSPSDVTSGQLTIGSGLNLTVPHFVLFCSGALDGEWFQVISYTATTVTVSEDLEALGALAADTVKVIPFWTLDTLFPDGEGFPVSTDVLNPVAFVLLNDVSAVGTNLSSGNSYFYNAGNQIATGWYLNGSFGATVDDQIITPETYFTIRNASGADSSAVISGGVPVDSIATQVGRLAASAQDNQLVNPYPTPLSLENSKLFESGAVTGSTDVLNPIDFVLVYDNVPDSGTNVSPARIYFYNSGIQIPVGWYLNGSFGSTAGDDTIPAGGAFVVRKANGAAGTVKWSPPVPYASQL